MKKKLRLNDGGRVITFLVFPWVLGVISWFFKPSSFHVPVLSSPYQNILELLLCLLVVYAAFLLPSYLSGWLFLAKHFRVPKQNLEWKHINSVKVGIIPINYTLRYLTDTDGLHLSLMGKTLGILGSPFPDLCIPWASLDLTGNRKGLFRSVSVYMVDTDWGTVSITFPEGVITPEWYQ